MQITKQKIWTYEDYYKLEDDKRYEIIEGELIEMAPAPRPIHQIISSNLNSILWIYVKDKGLGRVLASPLDIVFDKINTLQPDLVFISKAQENIIQEKNISGVPDLVVEILSPSNPDYDKKKKYDVFQKFRVKEYWIIDPVEKKIEVFILKNEKLVSFCMVKGDEKVNSKIFSEINLTFNLLIE